MYKAGILVALIDGDVTTAFCGERRFEACLVKQACLRGRL